MYRERDSSLSQASFTENGSGVRGKGGVTTQKDRMSHVTQWDVRLTLPQRLEKKARVW